MLRALLAALSLCIAAGVGAQPAPSADVAPKTAPKPAAKAAAKKPVAKAPVRPTWAELSADQQQILAPLKEDWVNLEVQRRHKWLGIAKRYPNMKAEEQARVQRRMQAWAMLTPEQRRQARESYKNIAKDKDRHGNLREHWAEYQALPPEEREALVPVPAEKKRR
jgi:uncharacterized protein DUF3106